MVTQCMQLWPAVKTQFLASSLFDQQICGFQLHISTIVASISRVRFGAQRSGLAEEGLGWRCGASLICARKQEPIQHHSPTCDSLDAEVLASEDGTDTTTGAIYFEGFPPSIAFFVVRAVVGLEVKTQYAVALGNQHCSSPIVSILYFAPHS